MHELAGLAEGSPEQRAISRRILEAGGFEVGGEDFFEVAPDGDLPRPAAFSLEAQLGLSTGVGEAAAAELGDGAGAGGGVGE